MVWSWCLGCKCDVGIEVVFVGLETCLARQWGELKGVFAHIPMVFYLCIVHIRTQHTYACMYVSTLYTCALSLHYC